VRAFALTSDDLRLLSASWDGQVLLWDTETGREVLSLFSGPRKFQEFAISPDDKFLAAGDDSGGILFWDIREQSR
jgi:WD40 repeat protein